MSVAVIAHCDWSIDRNKRWMCVAVRRGTKWILSAPEPVGETKDFIPRLRNRADAGAALLIGFDFPIGLPAGYGKALGLADFRSVLRAFGAGRFERWFDVAEHRSDIAIDRPFYPMRPGGTQRQHLFDALGVGSGGELLRRCERATADRGDACMLFWTLGGNQVGKAAITGWQEIIMPNLSEVALWPFDGSLAELTKPGATVVAETYPGDVYSQLGIPRRPVWSKRQQAGRRRAGDHLLRWLVSHPHIDGAALEAMITDGFGIDKAGEDRFDAVVGLLGMLDVVEGRRAEGLPDDDDVTIWEGWIFGQGA
ncbi:DUF429 domain-containing protein [Rhizobium leguminosarum]|uniref:DUF429 domain-containing protein n=1 Tax=Rhizobium ruizarguesonis TaxID=2081791 RepID=UPI00103103FA|nr:DUF429 domain-containing protein [Rhizobium ruizarguesonis]NEI14591.1 DUF429 domain-containing protein [Rhizobium ruizarguesonis]TAW76204.1 DUF429 domain-containing protein [Rhizobium ruizarguesonis]TAX13159.1 DUF429 domain-containing protein [Rhizobium ruizarguesonis]TAX17990.1 DUF429 domain-containing protein [Rhizobium ruizarguesonis]